MNTNSPRHYGSWVITLHCVMVALVVGIYACIELRELYPEGSAGRDALKNWHYMLGLTAFALVWLRLIARLAGQVPPIVPAPPRWQQLAAHAIEYAIYLFAISMPLLGWLIVSGEGKSVSYFGFNLPQLMRPDKNLAQQLEEVHEFIGNLGYGLIGIHVLAALFHHYVQRDNTLRRMLPGRP